MEGEHVSAPVPHTAVSPPNPEPRSFTPDHTQSNETTLSGTPPSVSVAMAVPQQERRVPSPVPKPARFGGWTRMSGRKIVVGVCAREKKARSKAMTEILSRFSKHVFEIVLFGDQCILHEPVEQWPRCDALIAFYSSGFPLKKAEQYADMYKPFILNDLRMQRTLHDRRLVYNLLMENNIDVPVHAFLSRDGTDAEKWTLEEYDEYIVVNGQQINKPLVEKPADAEDHNVYIYYPLSMGGGSKRLFRKVGDRSSEFYPEINEVRPNGSYIYEEFVETQGTDVKVYTVGPDYGHAEARKSPVVDGKVNRNEDGKEVRFPVILSPAEKEIARKVCIAFKQTVCGFDLLRVQGRSYVCDVNGWSFVKNSRKYYDDCAQLLTEFITAALEPGMISGLSAIGPLIKRNVPLNQYYPRKGRQQRPPAALGLGPSPSEPMLQRGTVAQPLTSPRQTGSRNPSRQGSPDLKDRGVLEHKEELRCVIAVIRHGDRTPKQKMKMMTSYPGYLVFYHKFTDDCRKDVKIKSKSQLLEFLALTKTYITHLQEAHPSTSPRASSDADLDLLYKLHQIRDVLERSKIAGFNRKLQLKPRSFETRQAGLADRAYEVCSELMLILKWGGDLTKLGEKQAATLGERFTQTMYPDPSGGGILRLHSTFRHDLKIKASDEGRVMKTAAAFTKGMLELEGELTPILVSLVHREKQTIHMLDPSGNIEIKRELEECKQHLHQMMQQDVDLTDDDIDQVVPMGQNSIKRALRLVKNPRRALFRMRDLISQLSGQLDSMVKEQGLLHEPINRTGSFPTLGNFMSANNLLPPDSMRESMAHAHAHMDSHTLAHAHTHPESAHIHGEARGLTFSDDASALHQTSSGSMAGMEPPESTGSGASGWADLRLHPVPASSPDLLHAARSPSPLPPGGAGDGLICTPTTPVSNTPTPRAHDGSLANTIPTATAHNNARGRRGTSVTDFDGGDLRWEDGTDGGYPDSEVTWTDGQTGSRSNSVSTVAAEIGMPPEDLPRAMEPHGRETLILMLDRWRKLHKDLYSAKTDSFDLSKVPDVHDNIRYDMLHNWHLGLRGMDELSDLAKHFADCIVPQEYGVDKEEKRILGSHMCQALLEKIKYDLIIARTNESFDVRYNLDVAHAADLPINSLGRRVRTRLYFTSESHLHSLLNVMRFPEDGKVGCFTEDALKVVDNTPELCYLTHVVFRMFEDLDKDEEDPTRFRIEILFSPGVTAPPSPVAGSLMDHLSKRHVECEKWRVLNPGLTWDDLNTAIDDAMRIGRSRPSLARTKGSKPKRGEGATGSLSQPSLSSANTGASTDALALSQSSAVGPHTAPPTPSHKSITHTQPQTSQTESTSVSAPATPSRAPADDKRDYPLFLEQGLVNDNHDQLDASTGSQQGFDISQSGVCVDGTSEAWRDALKNAEELLNDDSQAPNDAFDPRGRSSSSAFLSAAVVAAASVIGGMMLLKRDR